MPHCRTASGFECLTHFDQDLIRCCAHEREQLGAILDLHRPYALMRLSIGRAVPIEIGATGTPTIPAVLADGDFGICRVVSTVYRSKLAAYRQLPADIRLGFQEIATLAQSQQVQCAALTCWKSWTIQKDAGAVDHPCLATRQFALGNVIRMLLFDPARDACITLVLPLASLQLPDRLADSFLVLGVSKVRAQGAAAVVRPVGVDTSTASPVDAGPP